VLEEAPAPGMTGPRRAAMSQAAVDAARAVGYVGAGTVEFIVDAAGSFHFMEMNTRLQVEHPVTEMITGLDLVEWQLRVAGGEPLPLTQDQVKIDGHALEARIYAEDPDNGFLPSTGMLLHLEKPQESKHVRLDFGVEANDQITPFYDPMIGKLIVWDQTRELALSRISRALSELQIVGVQTNIPFLQRLIATPSFAMAKLDTSLIERENERLLTKGPEAPSSACLFAALAVLLKESRVAQTGSESAWSLRDGWRISSSLRRTLTFLQDGTVCAVEVEYGDVAFRMRLGDQTFAVSGELGSDGEVIATINGLRTHSTVVEADGTYHVFSDGGVFLFKWVDPLAFEKDEALGESSLLAPMPCLVTTLLAKPGEPVEQGTPLMVVEAMKMEYTIKAPGNGSVQAFHFAVGDQVSEGTQLLSFEPAPEKAG
jgi:3-methylcrotonyl-CoA carboxylase alpha subunit